MTNPAARTIEMMSGAFTATLALTDGSSMPVKLGARSVTW
jgi:hypothetical protein